MSRFGECSAVSQVVIPNSDFSFPSKENEAALRHYFTNSLWLFPVLPPLLLPGLVLLLIVACEVGPRAAEGVFGRYDCRREPTALADVEFRSVFDPAD